MAVSPRSIGWLIDQVDAAVSEVGWGGRVCWDPWVDWCRGRRAREDSSFGRAPLPPAVRAMWDFFSEGIGFRWQRCHSFSSPVLGLTKLSCSACLAWLAGGETDCAAPPWNQFVLQGINVPILHQNGKQDLVFLASKNVILLRIQWYKDSW